MPQCPGVCLYLGYEYNRVYMRTQQYIMERIRYVGKISRQGNKRMVIIPTEYHDKVTRIGDKQVHVDISLVYDDEDVEPSKRSKK
jgi:hypothetical protein